MRRTRNHLYGIPNIIAWITLSDVLSTNWKVLVGVQFAKNYSQRGKNAQSCALPTNKQALVQHLENGIAPKYTVRCTID